MFVCVCVHTHSCVQTHLFELFFSLQEVIGRYLAPISSASQLLPTRITYIDTDTHRHTDKYTHTHTHTHTQSHKSHLHAVRVYVNVLVCVCVCVCVYVCA